VKVNLGVLYFSSVITEEFHPSSPVDTLVIVDASNITDPSDGTSVKVPRPNEPV
jgi:hypothetical protein